MRQNHLTVCPQIVRLPRVLDKYCTYLGNYITMEERLMHGRAIFTVPVQRLISIETQYLTQQSAATIQYSRLSGGFH